MKPHVLSLMVAGLILSFTTLVPVSLALAQEGKLPAPETSQNPIQSPTLDQLRAAFGNPGVDYATAPLWTWNDLLTEEQIRSSLRDLAEQHVKMAFVHPRPGLMTPYLSEDWFRLWRVALDEADKLGMKIWIYDENSYPSGFAGGFVPDVMPESRGMGLNIRLMDTITPQDINDDTICILQKCEDGSFSDQTAVVRQKLSEPNAALQGHSWALVQRIWAGKSQWFGGRTYVNLLTPGVTQKFLEVTHEAYRQQLGEHFGKRIPGLFTDEPQVVPAGGFPWADDLPQAFQTRWGYDLMPELPALVGPTQGDWKRLRHNYHQLLHELFVERWAQPCFEFCEKNALQFTGHYWEHDWPIATWSEDNMAMYIWHHRPAIDLLCSTYDPKGGQFGNVRSGRELSSVAHQCGRSRTLSENYGAGGYDIRFEDLKRLGNWAYAMGVNTTDEHLSYITIRGARKHDHPQTFSYHSAWFSQYKTLADYWTRLSFILSQGELSKERFLLLEPTTTSWMYQNLPELSQLEASFRTLVNALENRQLDYDLGSEDILARLGSCRKTGATSELVVGRAAYRCVVLPEWTENVNQTTLNLLAEFVQNGGTLRTLSGKPIERVDGQLAAQLPAETAQLLSTVNSAAQRVTLEELATLQHQTADVSVLSETAVEDTFHQLRQLPECDVLFLCNTNMELEADGKLALKRKFRCVECWNPATGERTICTTPERYHLPACGSLVLVFHDGEPAQDAEGNTGDAEARLTFPLADKPLSVKPLDKNVLSIDYMQVETQGETLPESYFYPANAWLWQKNGFEKSPWDNGVQFRDELLHHEFAENSGFRVNYRFSIDSAAKNDLQIVVEHPEAYAVTVNGSAVQRIPSAWKYDRSFGVFDIAPAVQDGENVVTLTAAKMDVFCELMPLFVVGDFLLKPVEKGFQICNVPFTLEYKPGNPEVPNGWAAQGAPFYANAVEYSQTLTQEEILQLAGMDANERVKLQLPPVRVGWNGAVAAVLVNGQQAGTLFCRNDAVDIKPFLHEGENTLTVRIYGTPKNQFGPHHIGPHRNSAWPDLFHQAPETQPAGTTYDFIQYGLF